MRLAADGVIVHGAAAVLWWGTHTALKLRSCNADHDTRLAKQQVLTTCIPTLAAALDPASGGIYNPILPFLHVSARSQWLHALRSIFSEPVALLHELPVPQGI